MDSKPWGEINLIVEYLFLFSFSFTLWKSWDLKYRCVSEVIYHLHFKLDAFILIMFMPRVAQVAAIMFGRDQNSSVR